MEPTSDSNPLFTPSGCLEKDALLAYLRQQTRPEQTRAIELHLAACPLCSDAADGLALLADDDAISRMLQEARPAGVSAPLQESGTALQKTGRIRHLPTTIYIAVAASLAVFLISYATLRYLGDEMKQKDMVSLEKAPEATIQHTEKPNAEPVDIDRAEEETRRPAASLAAGKTSPAQPARDEQSSDGIHDGWFETSVTADNRTAVTGDYMNDLDRYSVDATVQTISSVSEAKNVAQDKEDRAGDQQPLLAGEAQGDEMLEAKAAEKTSGKKESNGRAVLEQKTVSGAVVSRNAPASAAQAKDRNGLLSGMNAYNEGDYAGAAGQFRQALKQNPKDANARYYYGMSLVFQKQYSQALEQFAKITLNDGAGLYEAANWQMARVYMSTGDKASARTILYTIIDGNGSYRQAAEEAIELLKEP